MRWRRGEEGSAGARWAGGSATTPAEVVPGGSNALEKSSDGLLLDFPDFLGEACEVGRALASSAER